MKIPEAHWIVWKENASTRFCISGPVADQSRVEDDCIAMNKAGTHVTIASAPDKMPKADVIDEFERQGLIYDESLYGELYSIIDKPRPLNRKVVRDDGFAWLKYSYDPAKQTFYLDKAIPGEQKDKAMHRPFNTAEQRQAWVAQLARRHETVALPDSEFAALANVTVKKPEERQKPTN